MKNHAEQGHKKEHVKVLNMRELANETGISYWFWQKHVKRGNVPCIKVGNKILFRLHTIHQWFAQCEAASVLSTNQHGKLRRVD